MSTMRRCRSSPRRSTCLAPRSMASSPSIMIFAASPRGAMCCAFLPGRGLSIHVLRLCHAEACQSMGCEKLAAGLRARLGIDFGGTTPDGRLTLETVYCLGAGRADRRDPLSQEAGAPDLRALRHHRSAVDRRLPRPWRLRRPEAGAGDGAGGDRRGGDRLGPARPRRRRLPHRHQVEDGARRSGRPEIRRAATPTRATRGTFADRMLMEGDPFVLIEGMTIAGIAVGATQGLHLHPLRVSRMPSRR